jgi:hypothetical protein
MASRSRKSARLSAVAAVAVVMVAAAALPPATAGTLTGRSGKSLRVRVHTAADGTIERLVASWRARCRRPSFSFIDRTEIRPQPGDAFRARGAYTLRDAGGIRARVVVRASGRRASIYRWDGSFAASAVVRRHGRVVDRCRLPLTRWRATAPEARLDMTSDRGDYIGGGQSYSYATPEQAVTIGGNRRQVSVRMGGWSVEFDAPPGRALTPGRFAEARRYPFNDRSPGLSIHGHGRGCNELTGEFTVHRSSFDRRGRVRAFSVSFEQHCEGGSAALRGSFSYRR